MPSSPSQVIVVIGAGPVGLCCALAFAQAGHSVTLLDSGARGAGWASGGMLGAVYETLGRDDLPSALTALAFESLDLWTQLALAFGIDAPCNSLFLARTDTEAVALSTLAALEHAQMCETTIHKGMMAQAAWSCARDLTLNPRKALQILRDACQSAGVAIVVGNAIAHQNGSVVLADGAVIHADIVIVASGHSGGALADTIPELAYINPVKGQMLAVVGGPDLVLTQTIRAGRLYLLHRRDQIVIGATSNADDLDGAHFDMVAQHDLHQEAIALWPALANAPIVESWFGFRPMTPDGLPLVGRSRTDAVYLATGTYRNGWLLAPAIAKLLVALASEDKASDSVLQPFSPQRFPI